MEISNVIKYNGNLDFVVAAPIPCIKYPLKSSSSKLVCNGIKIKEIATKIKKCFALKFQIKFSGANKILQ